MQKTIKYEKFNRQRLDAFLASEFKEYSRSYFQKLLENKGVFVDGKNVAASYKLKSGDEIKIIFSKEEKTEGILPQKIPLQIIYEDSDILALNKQSGIVTHPSYGHPDGSLLNGLVYYAKGKFKIYLVHRLDKDTTGLILFAKNEKAKISLSKQFQKRAVKKFYYAAASGIITENAGIIEAPLGRSLQNRKIMAVSPLAKKAAISEFKVIKRKENYTLLEIRIITGRTHQIRGHLKYINHPVLGDREYGGYEMLNGKPLPRQILHSHKIIFTHPSTCKTIEIEAKLPQDICDLFT